MNEKTIEQICVEIGSELIGNKFGKIFALSRFRLAIDFRLNSSKYVYISVEPSAPRFYIIERRLRDLEKQSKNLSPFLLLLRGKLSGAVLESIDKLPDERIIRLNFAAQSEIGQSENYRLIIQLTGRSANIFLLDDNNYIIDAMRENNGKGQENGDVYLPPERFNAPAVKAEDSEVFPQKDFPTLSAALDAHYQAIEAEKTFQTKAGAARNKLKQELGKRQKLYKKLKQDLDNHGDAETWKRFGDLLLANLATAVREGDRALVIDYFDETVPTIDIQVDENSTLTEAAEKYFKRYTKARNAKEEVSKRLAETEAQIAYFAAQKERLEEAIEERDESILSEYFEEKPDDRGANKKEKSVENFTGARRYTSSDGFEILVGKGAKDNDYLTFRVARSLDLWMHAADYPGSHVVIKNPNRQEIPQKTLLEAAQLAAFFSQARNETKAAVHYTQKKFVNKPKGAVPGLVSLASFKTILVEPKVLEK